MFEIIISGILGYFVGSFFISYYWGKLRGVDLTEEGTGQLGASNAGRVLGWPIMIIAGIFDILKATFTLIVLWLFFNFSYISPFYQIVLITGSLGIILGHVNSLWIWLEKNSWHGGKGGAPFGGILLFISLESFVFLFLILMVLIQLIKKFFLEGKTYDNFSANAVIVILSPFTKKW